VSLKCQVVDNHLLLNLLTGMMVFTLPICRSSSLKTASTPGVDAITARKYGNINSVVSTAIIRLAARVAKSKFSKLLRYR
jgi:hypothetical protein